MCYVADLWPERVNVGPSRVLLRALRNLGNEAAAFLLCKSPLHSAPPGWQGSLSQVRGPLTHNSL